MKSPKCEKCLCRKCVYNAEDYADGMCLNCENCEGNNFKYKVNRLDRCLMYRDELKEGADNG